MNSVETILAFLALLAWTVLLLGNVPPYSMIQEFRFQSRCIWRVATNQDLGIAPRLRTVIPRLLFVVTCNAIFVGAYAAWIYAAYMYSRKFIGY